MDAAPAGADDSAVPPPPGCVLTSAAARFRLGADQSWVPFHAVIAIIQLKAAARCRLARGCGGGLGPRGRHCSGAGAGARRTFARHLHRQRRVCKRRHVDVQRPRRVFCRRSALLFGRSGPRADAAGRQAACTTARGGASAWTRACACSTAPSSCRAAPTAAPSSLTCAPRRRPRARRARTTRSKPWRPKGAPPARIARLARAFAGVNALTSPAAAFRLPLRAGACCGT